VLAVALRLALALAATATGRLPVGEPAERLAQIHGQREILALQQIKDRQLAQILADAAEEAEGMVATNLAKLTFSGEIRAAQLQQAIKGLGDLSTQLWDSVGTETRKGIYAASYLAADQAIDLDLVHGMPTGAIMQYAQQMHFYAAQSAEDIISRKVNNINLADKIYANGRVTVQHVGEIIDKSLALQLSAKEIADRTKQYFAPTVPGGANYAAMRLGRTEINNAHHTTTIRQAQKREWVSGFKWNLSGSHPKPDECNQYAEHNGDGVFAKDEVPGKPHPQCLCYLTSQMPEPEDFVNNLINGDYDGNLMSHGVRC
jgi:hypothetical protein